MAPGERRAKKSKQGWHWILVFPPEQQSWGHSKGCFVTVPIAREGCRHMAELPCSEALLTHAASRPGGIFWCDVTPCLNVVLAEMHLSNLVVPDFVCCEVHARWVLKDTDLQDEYFRFVFSGRKSLASIWAYLLYCSPHFLFAFCLRELKFPPLRDFWVRPSIGFRVSLSLFYYNILRIIIVGITQRVYKAMACGHIIHSIYVTMHLSIDLCG